MYTNFPNYKKQKNNEHLICFIFVNSDKEYYPQIFLEECKYVIKNRKIINTINEDLELSESDDDKSDDE